MTGVPVAASKDPSGDAPISLRNAESSESACSSCDDETVLGPGLPNMRMRCSSVKLMSRFVACTLLCASSLRGGIAAAETSFEVLLEDHGHQPMMSVHVLIFACVRRSIPFAEKVTTLPRSSCTDHMAASFPTFNFLIKKHLAVQCCMTSIFGKELVYKHSFAQGRYLGHIVRPWLSPALSCRPRTALFLSSSRALSKSYYVVGASRFALLNVTLLENMPCCLRGYRNLLGRVRLSYRYGTTVEKKLVI